MQRAPRGAIHTQQTINLFTSKESAKAVVAEKINKILFPM